MFEMSVARSTNRTWAAYSDLVKRLTERQDEKERRRFRRVVSPERIARHAETVLASADKRAFDVLVNSKS